MPGPAASDRGFSTAHRLLTSTIAKELGTQPTRETQVRSMVGTPESAVGLQSGAGSASWARRFGGRCRVDLSHRAGDAARTPRRVGLGRQPASQGRERRPALKGSVSTWRRCPRGQRRDRPSNGPAPGQRRLDDLVAGGEDAAAFSPLARTWGGAAIRKHAHHGGTKERIAFHVPAKGVTSPACECPRFSTISIPARSGRYAPRGGGDKGRTPHWIPGVRLHPSAAWRGSRSSRRRTLPARLRGKVSTNSTSRGTL